MDEIEEIYGDEKLVGDGVLRAGGVGMGGRGGLLGGGKGRGLPGVAPGKSAALITKVAGCGSDFFSTQDLYIISKTERPQAAE